MTTHILGYPRIGEKRELKTASEAFWKGKISEAELQQTAERLRAAHWHAQKQAGIDYVACNDFSFYDQVLDTLCLVGAVPARFHWEGKGDVDLTTYFRMARGILAAEKACDCGHDHGPSEGVPALEMTKWFDTNYHYLVPELGPDTAFRLASRKPFNEFAEAKALGLRAKPVILGPVTFLSLAKATAPGFDRFSLLEKILPVYEETLRKLSAAGAEWVQLDEPVFALDLSAAQRAALEKAYARLAAAAPGLKILLATYFGPLQDNRDLFLSLPVAGYHIDAVRGAEEAAAVAGRVPEGKVLSVGVIDGRNIWKADLVPALALLNGVAERLGTERLWVAPSCSLLHAPVSLRAEQKIDPELKGWLAFAEEKLAEVRLLADALAGKDVSAPLRENAAALEARRQSPKIHRADVAARAAAVTPQDFSRQSPFPQRQARQHEHLKLPAFPTTTIGSFPQTAEVRAARAKWKKGELSNEAYEKFLKDEIAKTVRLQEELDIDMPVHGEFERNDMVEYFGEQLEGYAFTENGWVQSYGSRCVKPPILFGDVARRAPMTVSWSQYAQSLTKRPMKGMLTGPITMLQWSFVRDDQPRRLSATHLALALRDEVCDLEKAGLAAIQIDEPALREGLPLRRGEWEEYLGWAVDLFRLSAGGVKDETQIHTHMCYGEFNDILPSIARLDADVISIEASRSGMELLRGFADFKYPNEIGPGVWDIHSPRVPSQKEMEDLLRKALAVIPRRNLWANPDCGLKTRGWEEVVASLRNLVAAAKALREEN
ncbi:MAG: 5-methyltetrahydropteroyltriglutamate--homocysteine S-methyltransferase [Verrucomicrobium sp.]|nr:5-methyltetrahydropteroyltriglutamate--homocysteine S-methyltransferase [Verrucomicrobium sp.]